MEDAKEDLSKTRNRNLFEYLPLLLTFNRIAFLFGATNCIIYIIGYYMEDVYGTMITTVFSACLQFASFFVWKKRAYKQATEFRVLKNKSRILLVVLLIGGWVVVSYALASVTSKEYVVDGLNTVIGFILPFMQMFALIDSVPLHLLSIVLSLVMWIRIIFIDGAWANTTYLISTTFSLYMAIRMARKWIALYKEQQSLKVKKDENLN